MNELAFDKVMHAASGRALGFGNVIWLTVLISIMITSLRSMTTFVKRFLYSVLIIMLNFFCCLVSVTQSSVARLSKSLAISIGNDEMNQLQYKGMKIDFNLNCYNAHNLYWLATGTSATNISITNHKLGLISHHRIRGNYNNKLHLSNLDMRILLLLVLIVLVVVILSSQNHLLQYSDIISARNRRHYQYGQ